MSSSTAPDSLEVARQIGAVAGYPGVEEFAAMERLAETAVRDERDRAVRQVITWMLTGAAMASPAQASEPARSESGDRPGESGPRSEKSGSEPGASGPAAILPIRLWLRPVEVRRPALAFVTTGG